MVKQMPSRHSAEKKSAEAVINIIIRKSSTIKQATAKICELRS